MKTDMQNKQNLFEKMGNCIDSKRIIKNAPMSRYTTFRAGGCADMMVIVETVLELKNVLSLLTKEGIPYIFIGNGSNVLVKDGGYRGVVIKQGENFNEITIDGEFVTAFAGAKISAVVKFAADSGLSGMEFAGGIPGSVGGGVFMNAGAYGGEIKDILVSAKAVSADGQKEYEIIAKDMELAYRNSIFHRTGDIIVSATFKLEKGDKSAIMEKIKELLEKRNQKQPVNLPSAGSFFKRPEGYFAGKLIQDAGLKGLSVGEAQVSPLHAGFIVNNNDATAKEILQLMKIVQNTVFDKFGVWLEPEVRILGEE